MSTTIITVEEVLAVEPHPNADRLEILTILGFQVCSQKDKYKVGDKVFYFPPDILLPDQVANDLGVKPYLKHATFPGDNGASECRVGAARLRGVASYGFVAEAPEWCRIGQDVTSWFGAEKYVPPVRLGGGDIVHENAGFHRYTNIENIARYPDLIPEGTPVLVSEKLHGTNCRMGLCRDNDGLLQYMAGSHRLARKDGLYWLFFSDSIKEMLRMVSAMYDDAEVIVFGEIFGPGVQDMHYGQVEKTFRAFDMSVNMQYIDYEKLVRYCGQFDVPLVPELYVGPYGPEVLKHTDGPSKIAGKIREGIVIKALEETPGNRRIAKSISVDYLDRKNAQDNE